MGWERFWFSLQKNFQKKNQKGNLQEFLVWILTFNYTRRVDLLLLVGDTDSATTAASSLGVLTTDTETPVVTETTVRADALEALEVFTELGIEGVGEDLGGLAVLGVLLSVQEPVGDLVVQGVLQNLDNLVNLLVAQFTSTTTGINLGLLGSQSRQTTANTTNRGEGDSYLLATINVRVQHTNNVLELVLLENGDR